MLHYVVGGTLLTYITTNILNSLILSTVDTMYSGVSFVRHGTESNKAIMNIRKEIVKLDIKVKLELVKTLMDSLPVNDITKVIENGLIELMYNIKTVVDWIDYAILKHQEKWFSGYRSISFDDKIEELKNLIFILDGRINLLMNVGKN
jgi:hypothetical protein